jgi:hypothetical protein
MNVKHLGDALDSWKGWLLHQLGPQLRPVYVVPMFTDERPWPAECLALYARILRVQPGHIGLASRTFNDADRGDYFERAAHGVPNGMDVFIDPDNGPWTRNVRRKRDKYVRASEVGRLLQDDAERVALVYRHESRSCTLESLLAYVTNFVSGMAADAYGVGLHCGVTTMIAVSRSDKRIADLHGALSRVFSPVAAHRLTPVISPPHLPPTPAPPSCP